MSRPVRTVPQYGCRLRSTILVYPENFDYCIQYEALCLSPDGNFIAPTCTLDTHALDTHTLDTYALDTHSLDTHALDTHAPHPSTFSMLLTLAPTHAVNTLMLQGSQAHLKSE